MKTHARATATSALVLVAVFAAGTLVGRAWDRGSVVEAAPAGEAAQETGGGEEQRRTPMYERVGLSDAQRVQVDSIVVHYRGDVRELQRASREAYDQQYMALVEAVRESIKGVMDAEQRAQYDSMLAASDERRRARREEREREEGGDE